MVTKEQAMTYTSFTTVYKGRVIKWSVNGRCKTWKRDATRFRLPVKHGLYSYACIDNDNAIHFEVMQ